MKKIPLHGKYGLVDDEDFEAANQFSWRVDRKGYVWTGRALGLHQLIMKPPPGMMVDHRNGNPLDNRREKLRVCTRTENAHNRRMHSNNSTGYKGVSKYGKNTWAAIITVNSKNKRLGVYLTPEEAALAYNKAAIEYHGEFAHLNSVVL